LPESKPLLHEGGGSLANSSGLNARFVDVWLVFRV